MSPLYRLNHINVNPYQIHMWLFCTPCNFLCCLFWVRQEFFSSQTAVPFGVEPSLVHFSQSERPERREHHCSDQNVTTWRIVVVPSAQRRGPSDFILAPERLDTAPEFWRQRDEIQRLSAVYYRNIYKNISCDCKRYICGKS